MQLEHTGTSRKKTFVARVIAKAAIATAALAIVGATSAVAPSDASAASCRVVGQVQKCFVGAEYRYSATTGWVYVKSFKRYTLDYPTPYLLGIELRVYFYNTGRWVCIFTSSTGGGASFC